MSDAPADAPRAGVRAAVFAVVVTAAMIATPAVLPSIWIRMAIIEGVFAAIAIGTLALPWRALFEVRARDVAVGVAAAGALWLAGAAVIAAIRAIAPALAEDLGRIQGFAAALDPWWWVLVALPFIVATEDIVWRAAITLPLAQRLPWPAAALAAGSLFALAHVTSGPPLLVVAALACGTLWSAMAIATRRLAPVTAMHLTWDVLVVFVAPY